MNETAELSLEAKRYEAILEQMIKEHKEGAIRQANSPLYDAEKRAAHLNLKAAVLVYALSCVRTMHRAKVEQ